MKGNAYDQFYWPFLWNHSPKLPLHISLFYLMKCGALSVQYYESLQAVVPAQPSMTSEIASNRYKIISFWWRSDILSLQLSRRLSNHLA